MDEARNFKRVGVSFVVLYKVNAPLTVSMLIGNRQFDAIALDLSAGGIAVLTRYISDPIPAFTIVSVKFSILNDSAAREEGRLKSMDIKGEVRSSLFMEEKSAYRLGIRFIDISAVQRKFIADFVKMSALKQNDNE